jgi:hypothetical protein
MRFVIEVLIIGGSFSGFLEDSCSDTVFSAPVVTMSMPVVLRGAKELRVTADFGGILTAADIGTCLVNFLAVYEVLFEICLLRLFTYWNSMSWVVDSTEVLFTAQLYPASALHKISICYPPRYSQ